jgi:hypothetical protein
LRHSVADAEWRVGRVTAKIHAFTSPSLGLSARAATDHKKRERLEPSTDLDAWKAGYRGRIAAAEALLTSLPENEQPKQYRHIASLKRALTLGPEGLRKAAERAQRNRSEVLA